MPSASDDLREALAHQQRAIRAALEGDEGTCSAALLCCCGALIALASKQQEQIDDLRRRVREEGC